MIVVSGAAQAARCFWFHGTGRLAPFRYETPVGVRPSANDGGGNSHLQLA